MYCFYIQYFPVLWHWCWGELKKIAPTQLISYRALILNFFHHFIPIYILITTPVSSSYYFYFIRNIVPYSLSAYLASVLIKFFFFFEKLIEKKMVIDYNSLKYGRNHHFLEKKKSYWPILHVRLPLNFRAVWIGYATLAVVQMIRLIIIERIR